MRGSCSECLVYIGLRNSSESDFVYSYPHALHHLDLLQTAQFRADIAKDEWREILNQKQFDHWRTWCVLSFLMYLCNVYLLLYPHYRRDPTKQVYADANGNAIPGSSVPLSAPASAGETQQQSDQPQNQTQPPLSLKTEDVSM